MSESNVVYGGAVRTSFWVNEVNTFSELDVLNFDGTTWRLARADSSATLKTGVAINVSDSGFVLVTYGLIHAKSHGYNPQAYLYLSPTDAGEVQTAMPSLGGQYVEVVAQVYDADTWRVLDREYVAL